LRASWDNGSACGGRGQGISASSLWLGVLGLTMLMFSQGCGDPTGYGTPEGLFQAELKAFEEKDTASLIRTVPPDHRAAYRRVIYLAERYSQAVAAVAKQIAHKYGEDGSRALIRNHGPLWESVFAAVAVDGQIDWERVELDRSPAKVRAQLPGGGRAYATKLSDGRWYRVFGDTTEESLGVLAYSEGLLRGGLRELEEIRENVARNSYTEAQLLNLLERGS